MSAGGASPKQGDDVILVIDNDYERRYFYSATTATRGLGWFNFASRRSPASKMLVYRLDEAATTALTNAIIAAPRNHDPSTGKWLKTTAENFKDIMVRVSGVRR